MTNMKRLTVSLPDDLVEALEILRTTAEFSGKPYSEIIRTLIQRGLENKKGGGQLVRT